MDFLPVSGMKSDRYRIPVSQLQEVEGWIVMLL